MREKQGEVEVPKDSPIFTAVLIGGGPALLSFELISLPVSCCFGGKESKGPLLCQRASAGLNPALHGSRERTAAEGGRARDQTPRFENKEEGGGVRVWQTKWSHGLNMDGGMEQ